MSSVRDTNGSERTTSNDRVGPVLEVYFDDERCCIDWRPTANRNVRLSSGQARQIGDAPETDDAGPSHK